jgi:hypothetical protein
VRLTPFAGYEECVPRSLDVAEVAGSRPFDTSVTEIELFAFADTLGAEAKTKVVTTRPFTDVLLLICGGSFGERGVSIAIGNCSRSCKIGRSGGNDDYNNERNDTVGTKTFERLLKDF